jgi:hypothetical protein
MADRSGIQSAKSPSQRSARNRRARRRRLMAARRGERNGTAKLTEIQVREIRRRIGTLSLRQLAKEYGVSHTAIRRAATGAKWGHVA